MKYSAQNFYSKVFCFSIENIFSSEASFQFTLSVCYSVKISGNLYRLKYCFLRENKQQKEYPIYMVRQSVGHATKVINILLCKGFVIIYLFLSHFLMTIYLRYFSRLSSLLIYLFFSKEQINIFTIFYGFLLFQELRTPDPEFFSPSGDPTRSDYWRGYSAFTSGYQSVDRLSDIDEFEESFR